MKVKSAQKVAAPYEAFLKHLQRGELAYQFSPGANKAVFFPRLVCPFTGEENLEWRVSKGRGTVYSVSVVHPRKGDPYDVVLVDLDEGFRMMSRVEGCAPADVVIGQRVTFAVHSSIDEEDPYVIFHPTEQGK